MFSQDASQSPPPSPRPDTDMVGRWLIQNRQVWESEQLARVDRHLQSASDILESLGAPGLVVVKHIYVINVVHALSITSV
jgi:hypothetical protein